MFGKKHRTEPAGDGQQQPNLGGLSDQLAAAAAATARAQATAEDPGAGMTLGELDRFVHSALANGAGEDSPVMVRVNITAGVKRIWVREEKRHGN